MLNKYDNWNEVTFATEINYMKGHKEREQENSDVWLNIESK